MIFSSGMDWKLSQSFYLRYHIQDWTDALVHLMKIYIVEQSYREFRGLVLLFQIKFERKKNQELATEKHPYLLIQ